MFEDAAKSAGVPIVFAQDEKEIERVVVNKTGTPEYHTATFGIIKGELSGEWQHRNAATVR